jgi:polysaccharide pyruvyl transferase WcaK-like protein
MIPRRRKPKRILMTEIGNLSSGDEAICIGAARRLLAMSSQVTFLYRVNLKPSLQKARIPARHIYMPLEEEFEGVESLNGLVKMCSSLLPETFSQLRRCLLEHDLVVIAPGGRFTQGLKNARSLTTAAIAVSMGIPVIVLHQSVGPIDNPSHRSLVADVFSRCSLTLVRDFYSEQFLREIEVPESILVPCRDVVMGEAYPSSAKAPEYDLGINIRYGFNGHVRLDALAQFILNYKEIKPRARLLVYSTSFDLPVEVTNYLSSLPCEVQVKMPMYPNYLKFIGRCAINISDSFHGVLFSMLAGRPVICCQSDFKTWKIKGITSPEEEPLKVLPGFISDHESQRMLDQVLLVESDPLPLLHRQMRAIKYGKQLCEEGWTRVKNTVNSVDKLPM